MITGAVTVNREAVVRLTLRGPRGTEVEIDVVIDTGFTEDLTLPQAWVRTLGFPYVETNTLFLADGTTISVDLYEGAVVWDGQERMIVVHCMEGSPLLGMSLLYDYLLAMKVVDGGPVTIDAIP